MTASIYERENDIVCTVCMYSPCHLDSGGVVNLNLNCPINLRHCKVRGVALHGEGTVISSVPE